MGSKETNRGRVNVAAIRGVAEQQIFLFLKHIFPHGTQIEYEPLSFGIRDDKGVKHTTIPDFRIIKPGGEEVFLEITTQSRNGTDPKAKQKSIMQQAAPEIRYKVWYRETLKNIEKRHPNVSIFGAKRIRKE